ncbi:hypothetical protein [Bradyrhizobium liaoningense]
MDFLVNHEVIPKPVELSAEALQGSESLAHDPAIVAHDRLKSLLTIP